MHVKEKVDCVALQIESSEGHCSELKALVR
jgi:hypothetical protein